MSIIKRRLSLLIFLSLFFFIFTSPVSAQMEIGKFYSLGDPDWIEIKNINSTEDVDMTGYKIEDTAPSKPLVHEWKDKTIIPASGSCVIEMSNRLNNDGDTIYFKDPSGSQIYCVLYGDGNGGSCENIKEPSETSEKPLSNCFSPTPTPEPTQTPTEAPTFAPTPTKTATPAPTKTPTPKPTATPLKTKTPTPSPTSISEVLGETVWTTPETKVLENENESTKEKKKIPLTAFIFIGSGAFFLLGAFVSYFKIRKNGIKS